MVHKNILSFCLALCFWDLAVYAQNSEKDSASAGTFISASFAFQWPGADLARRFGQNSAAGGSFCYKSHHNILFGLEGDFLFGDRILQQGILDSISTPDGSFIGSDGKLTNAQLYERGFHLRAVVGKIFPLGKVNPNSGLFVKGGAGYLQHKIRIEIPGNTVPQLSDEYKKGYDHMCNGFALTASAGYLYIGKKRLVNFFGVAEFTRAWTQGRRFDFNTMQLDNAKRSDMLYGFRVGWIIPLYKRSPEKFYTY